MRPALIFPLLLILSAFSCKKPIETTAWKEYAHPLITRISIYDTLSAKSLQGVDIKEINGVKAQYKSGKQTNYFEYNANVEKLLKAVSKLSFKKCNAVIDTTCRTMNIPFSLSGSKVLSSEETTAAGFFWQIKSEDFFYYECIKAPSVHTLLVHKETGRILHRIETSS